MGVTIRKDNRSGDYYVHVSQSYYRKAFRIGTKKENAETAKRDLEKKIRRGEFSLAAIIEREKQDRLNRLNPALENKEQTFADYFEHFSRTISDAVRPATLQSYRYQFEKFIKPELGHYPLSAINRTAVELLLNKLKDQQYRKKHHKRTRRLAKDTIRLIIATGRVIYNHALKAELVSRNPFSGMGKLFSKIKKMHEEIHPLDSSEQSALLTTARKESMRDYYFFLTALHTGMRPGELTALDWSEVDFENKLIHVRFNLTKNGNREQPKTKSSIRDIHMSDILVRQLREWKRLQAKNIGKTNIVFSGLNHAGKTRINIGFIRRILNEYLQKAEVKKKIRLHDLRHTFATTMLEMGAPIERVSKMLGHASIQITSDVYYRYKPSANDFEYLDRLPR